jgi:hypothetical protein
MWSGPRNISTAVMRAFENRPDCAVIDEPLYAHYLEKTRVAHPGIEEVIASQPTDWREVIRHLLGPIPGGKPIWYQKHMTHHLLPEIDRAWMQHLAHCFLIRHPAEVLSSYARTRPDVTLEDLGFKEQAEIYDHLGGDALVIDSADLLAGPRAILTELCRALGIPFSEAMLSWPPGPRDTDGVWAVHWYQNVWASTGFQPREQKEPTYPRSLQPIVDAALPYYRRLHARRLTG